MVKFAFFGLLGLFLLFGCVSDPVAEIKEDTAILKLSGFEETCLTEPNIFAFDENTNAWRETQHNLPLEVTYYFNGEFVPFGGWCDVVSCQELKQPINIPLREIVQTGERPHPERPETMVPQYETKPLTGKLKIEYQYFLDSQCLISTNYSIQFEKK